jgi:hypothetical protein
MAAAQFFSVFLSCEADQRVGSDLPVGENTALRSSYEGRGRRSITFAMSLGIRQKQKFGQGDVISSAYRKRQS